MDHHRADATAGELAAAALAAREELVAGEAETVLLHGNFRQGKVLGGDRAPWLAVGPEPLVGERAYDLPGWCGTGWRTWWRPRRAPRRPGGG